MNFMFEWKEQYLTRSLRSLVRYCSCYENIKFISSSWRVMFFLLYKSTDDGHPGWRRLWWFSEDFQKFSKIVSKARWTSPNIFREFPKISEAVRRLPKTFEEDPTMFRWYTNEFKNNLRDKLEIGKLSISSHVRISYRFQCRVHRGWFRGLLFANTLTR